MKNVKKLLLILVSVFGFTGLKAQTDLIGNWELCKIVKLPSDTQLVKSSDPRYLKYNFNYNNTFTCYHEKEKEESTGKWGFDRKENTIKLKARAFTKTKVGIEDANIKLLNPINKVMFVQVIADKKGKPLEHYIYRKIP